MHLRGSDRFKGRNIGSFQTSVGIPDFLVLLRCGQLPFEPKGAGARFVYLNLNYKRIQEITSKQFLIFNLASQYSFNKLPLSEQFYIGGIDTVRGYPLATALGEQGYYLNFEYHLPIPFIHDFRLPKSKRRLSDLIQLLGFLDNGIVWVRGNDPFKERAPVCLTSAGLGVRLNNLYRFSANFDVGFGLTEAHRSSAAILYFKLSYKLF